MMSIAIVMAKKAGLEYTICCILFDKMCLSSHFPLIYLHAGVAFCPIIIFFILRLHELP